MALSIYYTVDKVSFMCLIDVCLIYQGLQQTHVTNVIVSYNFFHYFIELYLLY